VLDADFVELSILPALGARVDYLWGRSCFTDGLVATEGGRDQGSGTALPEGCTDGGAL